MTENKVINNEYKLDLIDKPLINIVQPIINYIQWIDRPKTLFYYLVKMWDVYRSILNSKIFTKIQAREFFLFIILNWLLYSFLLIVVYFHELFYFSDAFQLTGPCSQVCTILLSSIVQGRPSSLIVRAIFQNLKFFTTRN